MLYMLSRLTDQKDKDGNVYRTRSHAGGVSAWMGGEYKGFTPAHCIDVLLRIPDGREPSHVSELSPRRERAAVQLPWFTLCEDNRPIRLVSTTFNSIVYRIMFLSRYP